MTLQQIQSLADENCLDVLGAFHPSAGDISAAGTLFLLGPAGGFWDVLRAAPEYRDGKPDPVDRWSARVLGDMAQAVGGVAHFPFGGPPYAPFLDWAIQSGRTWPSEVGMLVHDRMGLMVSYRGAIGIAQHIELPAEKPTRPCDTCAGKPCLSACPVGALTSAGYDVPKCQSYLDTPRGTDCLNTGCAVRRICPISQGAKREAAQSAHHMRAFTGS